MLTLKMMREKLHLDIATEKKLSKIETILLKNGAKYGFELK